MPQALTANFTATRRRSAETPQHRAALPCLGRDVTVDSEGPSLRCAALSACRSLQLQRRFCCLERSECGSAIGTEPEKILLWTEELHLNSSSCFQGGYRSIRSLLPRWSGWEGASISTGPCLSLRESPQARQITRMSKQKRTDRMRVDERRWPDKQLVQHIQEQLQENEENTVPDNR
ncbi:hypothetical protein SRHO_G00077050 [Serrasalmus rhombeus]